MQNVQGVLRTIVIESNSPWRPVLGLFTPSKRCVKMVGTSRSPTPNDKAAARMNRSRRVHRMYDSTRAPDTITLAKRKVVTPPRTGFGTVRRELEHRELRTRKERKKERKKEREGLLARKTPEILPRMPKRRRKKQQNRPALRFAHRVIAMTPLFLSKRLLFSRRHKWVNFTYLREDGQRRYSEKCGNKSADAI